MNKQYFYKNLKFIENYPYYFGPKLVQFSGVKIEKNSLDQTNIDFLNLKNQIKLLAYNILDINQINKLELLSNKKNFISWKRLPLYLYYSIESFAWILNFQDLTKLNTNQRIVFLVGSTAFDTYFSNMQTILPEVVINDLNEFIKQKISQLKINREKNLKETQKNIIDYYTIHEKDIKKSLINKKYKILFITSRFMGYRLVRDMYDACIKLGYDAQLAIEESNINRIYYELYIDKYKPNIIFAANQFRFEFNYIPVSPIFITWILDRYDNIYNKETPKKLVNNDFIFNVAVNDDRLWKEYGYNKESLYPLLYPGNPYIYKKYDLTREEKKEYICDIVYVSNNTNFKKFVETTKKEFPTKYSKSLSQLFNDYYVLECTENSLYGHNPIQTYLKKKLFEYNINLSPEQEEILFKRFLLIRYSMKKYILAKWLIEQKKYEVKLWGLDWNDIPEFSNYSMGVAKYGENLSKIYQSAKVCIATQPDATYCLRIPEISLSNSLPLIGYIPEEHDIIPCKFIKLDKDIACYHSKEDLHSKLDFYLTHEKERKEMFLHTKKIVQNHLTTEKAIAYIFEIIENIIKE